MQGGVLIIRGHRGKCVLALVLSSGFPCTVFFLEENDGWSIKTRPKLYLKKDSNCRPSSRAIGFYEGQTHNEHVLVKYKVRKVYCRQDVCKSIISCMSVFRFSWQRHGLRKYCYNYTHKTAVPECSITTAFWMKFEKPFFLLTWINWPFFKSIIKFIFFPLDFKIYSI